MTLSSPKQFYSRFLKGHEGKLHFSAHSHHFWPDVTREAQLSYWDDCALLSDQKWDKIFSEIIPETQKHIASILHLKHPEQIVLAPNTHELSARLLSLFLGKKDLKILTTPHEFHSWRRQFLRLMELPGVEVTQTLDLKSEVSKNYDMVFISQVYFDSGLAMSDAEIKSLVDATPKTTLFVVDGYHGFAAIPTNLSTLEGRIFYLGGGYKYAQAGEGVGFMVVPKGEWRPAYTGWFAEHSELSKAPGSKIGYAPNAMAFMGATQDPSGFYRFNAVWNLFAKEYITVSKIHNYVVNLQKIFIQNLDPNFIQAFHLKPLYDQSLAWHGHFLTFEAASLEEAQRCQEALQKVSVFIDRRSSRLRFGFGLYQDEADVLELTQRLEKLAAENR